ncbi:nucleotidyltransferase domain-containing protein [Erysipelotrichaceae bacterium RD49]|nr:nucleotidyltransferase domain-containing protein [Erysipelotrichaceae bacterium RD49]
MVTPEQLQAIKQTVEKEFGRKVLAVFPVGSRTMDLVLPGSDLDLVVVVAPSLHDLFESSQFAGKLEGQDVTIKDVRSFVEMLKKQNPGVLNILNNDVYLLDPDYSFLMDEIWRDFDVFRCTMSALATVKTDLKRAGAKPETAAKFLARCWYNLDVAKYLLQFEKYPRAKELEHAGAYIQVKKGNLAALGPLYGKDPAASMLKEAENLMEEALNKKSSLRHASALDTSRIDSLLENSFKKTLGELFWDGGHGAIDMDSPVQGDCDWPL